METRELKLKLFNDAIDRFFAPYFVSNLNYLLNVFSVIANRKMRIGTAFFKNCLIENFIRLEKDQ